MHLIGNIIWIVLGGFFIFLQYLVGGFLLCLTIIGIPFGVQCWKLAILTLLPFGRDVSHGEWASGCLGTVMNILWILCGGIWIAFSHLVLACLFALTIIGIPFARQHLKLAALALTPFGMDIK